MSVMNNMPDFVRKREKIGYAIFAVIVTALLVSGLYAVLPTAITFFTMLQTAFMKLIVLAGTLLVGSFIVLNMKTAWMLLKILSRMITNQVYAIYPDSVMEECLKDAEYKRDDLRKRREEIGAVRQSLEKQVKDLEKERQELLDRIEAIKGYGGTNYAQQAVHLGNGVNIVDASLKRRREQYTKIDRVYKGVGDAAEICDRYIETKRQQLVAYKNDWAAARATAKAIKSARSVLGAFSGSQEDWNIAVGLIDDEFSRSLADVDVFMEEIKGDLIERDIDNMVALKRVEDIHRGLTGVRVDSTAATMSAEAQFHQTLQEAEARRAGGSR